MVYIKAIQLNFEPSGYYRRKKSFVINSPTSLQYKDTSQGKQIKREKTDCHMIEFNSFRHIILV